jgi:parallel beta-helix repeat protein
MRNAISILLTFSFIFLILLCGVNAKILYVDDDVQFPDAYSSIQDAINDAEPGDVIIVYPGEYSPITVNKQLILKGIQGEDVTVINAYSQGSGVILKSDGVVFEGFTVKNSGSWPEAGIKIISSNNTVSNCNIIDNGYYGIFIYYSANNNTISGNRIGNNYYGIATYYSKGNRLVSNELKNNFYAISLSTYSNNNTLKGNSVFENDYGIFLESSSNNILRNNSILNNRYNFGVWGRNNQDFINDIDSSNLVDGRKIFYLINKHDMIVSEAGVVYCIGCKNITVVNTEISNNLNGIYFYNTTDSNISGNHISNTWYGVRFQSNCINNTVKRNNLSANDFGIYLYSSSQNFIYLNNFINNRQNVYSYNSENIWSSSIEITYRYNSKDFSGHIGNYWSDNSGTDNNSDGVVDSPYPVNQDVDYYPLFRNFESYFPKSDSGEEDTRWKNKDTGKGEGGEITGSGGIISVPITHPEYTSQSEKQSKIHNHSIPVVATIRTPFSGESFLQSEENGELQQEKITSKGIAEIKENEIKEIKQQPTGLIAVIISLFAVIFIVLYLSKR